MARSGSGVAVAARVETPAVPLEVVRQVHPRNDLNDRTGGEWLYFTKSVITTAYPPEYGHELRKAHGACKPPRLMRELIEFFTKPEGRVLDPFAGVGGTLIGASICSPSREAVGIDVNPRWIEIYDRVCEAEDLPRCPIHLGDCREVLAGMPEESFSFCATDPPYNIHLERTMCNGVYDDTHTNRRTDYDMHSGMRATSRTSTRSRPMSPGCGRSSPRCCGCSRREATWP
jgi:DNA modification methylase